MLPKTYEDMHEFARTKGIDECKRILRQWVHDGQPDELMPDFTSRAMCRAASAGLENRPIEDVPRSCADTEHGGELYAHMWEGCP
jgi:hypothetical protein